MPLLSQVGRRSLRGRLLVGSIYAVLLLGSVTMIYPFLMMVSSSLTSHIDFADFVLVPEYLVSENRLMMKYSLLKGTIQFQRKLERFFEPIMQKFNVPLTTPTPEFQIDEMLAKEGTTRWIHDWYEFKESLPLRCTMPLFIQWTPLFGGPVLDKYHAFLRDRYDNDIDKLNVVYGETNEFFGEVSPPYLREEYVARVWMPEDTVKMREWNGFRETLSPVETQVVSGEEIYHTFLQEKKYRDIHALNESYGTSYGDFWQIRLPETLPEHPIVAANWEEFVRTTWPLRFLKLDKGEAGYHEFLRDKYGTIDRYNEAYGAEAISFEEIPFASTYPWVHASENSRPAYDWARFVRFAAPPDGFQLETTEGMYRAFLERRFGSIQELNGTYETSYTKFAEVTPPYLQTTAYEVRENKWHLRWDYATRSYRIVTEYMLLHGRAFLNTFILVLSLVLVQLTVNPLAAFALSKMNLPFERQALLFLVGTMAFPAAVGMIPNFLLLKELHLLNTYWAIILPAAANGYTIFILKNFFDGLPQELFEYCTLEGAGPLRQFWHVAVPLNKPIFAVIALHAFGLAYGTFMWAFVVCQKESMWTLMVWLHQFGVRWGTGPLMMSGLVLAAIPTLLVFIFCQRIIIRGIPLPTFK